MGMNDDVVLVVAVDVAGVVVVPVVNVAIVVVAVVVVASTVAVVEEAKEVTEVVVGSEVVIVMVVVVVESPELLADVVKEVEKIDVMVETTFGLHEGTAVAFSSTQICGNNVATEMFGKLPIAMLAANPRSFERDSNDTHSGGSACDTKTAYD